jgi:hypothetical protein
VKAMSRKNMLGGLEVEVAIMHQILMNSFKNGIKFSVSNRREKSYPQMSFYLTVCSLKIPYISIGWK